MMAPPLKGTSVREISKLLDLENWMRKNSGKALPPGRQSMIKVGRCRLTQVDPRLTLCLRRSASALEAKVC
jgi:hypothetical protein